MSNSIKVIILQDNPVHKKGTELDTDEFFNNYKGLSSYYTTESFFDWFSRQMAEDCENNKTNGLHIWFKIKKNEEELPLCFLFEDYFYSKDLSGAYTVWSSPSHYATRKNPIMIVTIPDVQKMLKNVLIKRTILQCTNNVNKQF